MKKKYFKLLILLLLFVFGIWGYYILRKKNTRAVYEVKSVLNETNNFFCFFLKGEKFNADLLQKLEQEYDIKKTNQYNYKISPKDLEASDFYGFEIVIDSLSTRIKYIGLYKP